MSFALAHASPGSLITRGGKTRTHKSKETRLTGTAGRDTTRDADGQGVGWGYGRSSARPPGRSDADLVDASEGG